MSNPHFLILFVDDPMASARFYTRLLEHPPIDASPGFAMFAMNEGLMLGLWSKHTAQPTPAVGAGSCELAFSLQSDAAVDARHSNWQAQGLNIIQPPTRLDFGYTFVALDPDGHRLRVFSPGAM